MIAIETDHVHVWIAVSIARPVIRHVRTIDFNVERPDPTGVGGD